MTPNQHLARIWPLQSTNHPQQHALSDAAAAQQQMGSASLQTTVEVTKDLSLTEGQSDLTKLDEFGVRSGSFGGAFQNPSSDSKQLSALGRRLH
jgi:hypothetical protein